MSDASGLPFARKDGRKSLQVLPLREDRPGAEARDVRDLAELDLESHVHLSYSSVYIFDPPSVRTA